MINRLASWPGADPVTLGFSCSFVFPQQGGVKALQSWSLDGGRLGTHLYGLALLVPPPRLSASLYGSSCH